MSAQIIPLSRHPRAAEYNARRLENVRDVLLKLMRHNTVAAFELAMKRAEIAIVQHGADEDEAIIRALRPFEQEPA